MATPNYTEVEKDGEKILVCDDCGKVRRCGDWPGCPHIPGNFGQEPLEPYFDEHITGDGEYITSRSQRRAIMNREGLEFRKKDKYLIPGRRAFVDLGGKSR